MANLKILISLLLSILIINGCYETKKTISDRSKPFISSFSNSDSLAFYGTPFQKKLDRQMFGFKLVTDVKMENDSEILEHNFVIQHEQILADETKLIKFTSAEFQNGYALELIEIEGWTSKQPLGNRRSYISQYYQPLPDSLINGNELDFRLIGENRNSKESYISETISIPKDIIELQLLETSLGLDNLFEKYGNDD
jgi:hypothetical protein